MWLLIYLVPFGPLVILCLANQNPEYASPGPPEPPPPGPAYNPEGDKIAPEVLQSIEDDLNRWIE
ncbi:hypothetical protein ACFLU4_01135 [Chloroflexota bacterium]